MTGDMADLKDLIDLVARRQDLSAEQAEAAFGILMSGDATPAQMGGFLMALRVKGETVAEVTGAARTMRAKALTIEAPDNAIDTVGTGGDKSGTFNISTATSFIVSAAGVPVAKHGNRALSSKTGAADVLTKLGVNIDCDMALVRAALWEAGICFLMATRHHSAMRHVGPVRVELGTRTLFNLLGPLANPALVRRQLVGVFALEWVEPIAHVLKNLGSTRAWVVHGSDGIDEITITGPTHIAQLADGAVTTFEITPEDAGVSRATSDEIKGGDAATNARALTDLLDGAFGAYRDIVVLNAAAALLVAEAADDLKAGAAIAEAMIDSGKAREKLAMLVAITNRTTKAAGE